MVVFCSRSSLFSYQRACQTCNGATLPNEGGFIPSFSDWVTVTETWYKVEPSLIPKPGAPMTSLVRSVENGVSLWRGGAGEPLLFLHAGGTGADVIRRLAEPFAHYRDGVVPDFPGYGGAPAASCARPQITRPPRIRA